jgi:hypothetical protein
MRAAAIGQEVERQAYQVGHLVNVDRESAEFVGRRLREVRQAVVGGRGRRFEGREVGDDESRGSP